MPAKIELIDTHAHIYSTKLMEDLTNVMNRSDEEGVSKIFMPNIDSNSIDDMLEVESRYDYCYPMMGLHPCSVNEAYREELELVKSWLEKRSFSGVGEIGIDLYWEKKFKEAQIESFEYQINLAKDHNLPFVIHSREALDLTIASVDKLQDGTLNGIFHCFNGTVEQGKQILDLGFFLGIGGVLTYKNSGVAEVISQLPLSGMVLETDSPYLAPVPKRGKTNEPSYLSHICQKLSEIHEVGYDDVALTTTKNAKKIFVETPK